MTKPAPYSRKRQEEVNQRRLLVAARRAFKAKGYSRANLRSIAQSIGVTTAVIYHGFGSKDGLWVAAMQCDPPDAMAFATKVENLLAHYRNSMSRERRDQLAQTVADAAETFKLHFRGEP